MKRGQTRASDEVNVQVKILTCKAAEEWTPIVRYVAVSMHRLP